MLAQATSSIRNENDSLLAGKQSDVVSNLEIISFILGLNGMGTRTDELKRQQMQILEQV